MKYFEKNQEVLLFFHENLKQNYWDYIWIKHWDNLKDKIYKFNPESIICKITSRFIHPNDGPILEGGCGLGKFVYFLKIMNYDVVGIDTAKLIINKLNKDKPNINVRIGDVRSIPFPDNYFIGYWSLGVIEHFFNGYHQVIIEMKRVIKPKGYLFITFPYMSPFRKFKSRIHLYKIFNPEYFKMNKKPKLFYQYALNKDNVIRDLKDLGFELIYLKPQAGIKGFKDETFFLKFITKRFLQLLYDNQTSKIINSIRVILDKFLAKFSGNTILLVFQRS